MLDPNKAVEQMQSEFSAGFQAGAASRDAEVSALEFSWAGCSQQLKDACADLEEVEQERDQLRAQINVLRDAFQTFIDEHEECQDADEWMAELCSMEALHVAGEALATTPEQSLAEYRNKVIEECAKRAEAYAYMSQNFNALAEELRAMKEQP